MRSRRDEFARLISSVECVEYLPERLRDCYLEALHSDTCQLSIYAPPISNLPPGHVQPIAGYLLMNFRDSVLVAVDRKDRPVEKIRIPLADLVYIEFGQFLLFSWLKLIFCSNQGIIKIPFNTVMARLFLASVNLIRDAIDLPYSEFTDLHVVTPNLEFKFNNVLHNWLRPKEVPFVTAFQPEVRTRRFLFLERQIMPPLLAVVTNSEFLTITEEPPVASEKLGRFSEIYTYCPHGVIEKVQTITSQNPEFAELRVTMVNGNTRHSIEWKLTAALAPRFDDLCRLTKEIVSRKKESTSSVLINS